MPPHVPRKRLRGDTPEKREEPPKKKGKASVTAAAKVNAPPRKATLFDALDATISPLAKGKERQRLAELSDDDSSLTSLSDSDVEFEDVPVAKRQKIEDSPAAAHDDDDDDDDDDGDLEFEDVLHPTLAPQQAQGANDGALELTLTHMPTFSYDLGGKKGPSKKERLARVATHCMHVQFLMWHNAIRNSWLCDPVVQGIMLSHLPPGMFEEVERFRRNSGLESKEVTPKKTTKAGTASRAKGKNGKADTKPARDWGDAAERLEKGGVNLSHGDPLFRLLRALSAWWRKRFHTTAPGLRKMGYMQTRRCANLIKGYAEGGVNPNRYGERISTLQWFRLRAQECSGSRDVGAQLFTVLLRALGLEARMVANLQPVGFGFNKLEEADADKVNDKSEKEKQESADGGSEIVNGRSVNQTSGKQSKASQKRLSTSANKGQPRQPGQSARLKGREKLEDESDELGDDDLELTEEDSEDESLVEIPPLVPDKNSTVIKFDRDLEFPHYWSEVLSPATHKYVSVDAIVKNVVGTSRDLIESLGSRGAKADKAKQVLAYIVGFSQDGTAKDVTVRYLKGQIVPGRTKGTRIPLERIPVHNKNGKIKRYDHFDWFRSVMRGYARGGENHPLTEFDYEEDSTDLKAAKPEKKEVKEGDETLQYYKQSKEFALARHLKREEALLPTAKPVKYFKNKGKKGDGEEEPVYLRKDIVQVKSEETWHKQGRAPKPGVGPLKFAPYRAATTNRRRELAEAEAASGHKVLQGLYSYDQTDWIIPPPIKNGIIPKNQYGNIDLFVEHMLPEGAAHVPYRAAIRVCRRLEIDFAEAVVDFEFGHRMAVPVIQGVVIAEEFFDKVMEEVAKEEAEKARKEDEKRRKLIHGTWRKLLMGMRIVERVRREYGEVKDSFQVFGHSRDAKRDVPAGEPAAATAATDEDMGGGFLPEGFEEDEEEDRGAMHKSSFFPAIDDEEEGVEEGNGLMVEDGSGGGPAGVASPNAGSDETVDHKSSGPRYQAPRRRTRRTVVPPSDEEEEVDGEDEDEEMGSDDEYEE